MDALGVGDHFHEVLMKHSLKESKGSWEPSLWDRMDMTPHFPERHLDDLLRVTFPILVFTDCME